MILCCDTATDFSLFVACDGAGHALASVCEEHRRNLSTRFYGCVDAVLAQAGAAFAQIDAFAVGLGPGSFTGVRIAVTSLRTLAQVTGKPLVGVCTLDIIAEPERASARGRPILALLPSRRNELYCALYPNAESEPRSLFAATHDDVVSMLHGLPAGPEAPLAVGPRSAIPAGYQGEYVVREAPGADSFARLAAAAVQSGAFADPLGLNPLYIVAPAINQHLDPKAVERLTGFKPEGPSRPK